MNKEEAIEYIKNYKYDNEVRQAIDTVLDYIADLEKENAVKESHIKIVSAYNEELEIYKRKHSLIKNHYISKDKIRDKIEELENLIKEAHKELGSASKEFTIYVSQEKILKELLEEEK